MPGKIIKLFDTQADWESGTLSNMDSATKPGSIAPNPSTAGPEVYWISPVIDTSKSKSDRLTIGVETDMDIKCSIRVSNTFSRSSTAYLSNGTQVAANVPRFEDGAFQDWCLSFDGVDDYVAVAHNSVLNVDYVTLEAWIYIKSYPTKTARLGLLVGKWQDDVNKRQYAAYITSDGYIRFDISDTGTWDASYMPLITTENISLNVWTHIACVYNGSTKKIYYNGTEKASVNYNKGIYKSDTGLKIGGYTTGTYYRYFNGNMTEVRIWNTARTQQQIQDNMYKQLTGGESGLVGYWKLNEGAGSVAHDSTPNANHGTIYGATWGKITKAIMVEEGTTNICTNPSFETDLTGWAVMGGGSAARTSNEKFYGNYSVKVTNTASDAGQLWYNVPNPSNYAGKTITVSAMVKCNRAQHANIAIRESDGSTYKWTNSPYHSGSSQWEKISVTVNLRSTVTDIQIQLINRVSDSATTDAYFDGVQFEVKPYSTSFTDSTRSGETLSLPTSVLNPQQGTVECWVLINDASKRAISDYPTIFMADGGGAGKGIWLSHSNTEPYFRLQVASEQASKNIRIADSAVSNAWHHFACTWNSTQAKLYLDGQLKGTMVEPPLPSAITALTIGCWGSGHQIDTLIDDLRISNKARSDAEILANYQSGKPVGFDSYTTCYEPFDGLDDDGLDDWQVVGVVFENPHTAIQVKIEPSKTKIGDQYIDSLGLWETITLPMLERPDIELAPPECNKVTVYTDTIEKSATVPGTSSDRIVEIRVEAPEGSSEAYCQQMADAILAAKSKERLSITCKVPLVTSLRFGELVPVILPYIGATIDTPYLAHVQRMEHHILENPPYTILSLGDFLPDDIEALVRLLKEG